MPYRMAREGHSDIQEFKIKLLVLLCFCFNIFISNLVSLSYLATVIAFNYRPGHVSLELSNKEMPALVSQESQIQSCQHLPIKSPQVELPELK